MLGLGFANSQLGAERTRSFCEPCNARHSAPTGARCKRNTAQEGEIQAKGARPKTTKAPTVQKSTPKRRGRKPSKVSDVAGLQESQSSNGSDMQVILAQLQLMCAETMARESDRKETQAAIKALSERLEESMVQSEEDEPKERERAKPQKKDGPRPFAWLARKGDVSGGLSVTPEMVHDALDPIARIRGDQMSNVQAQLVMNAAGVSDFEVKIADTKSGYYRN